MSSTPRSRIIVTIPSYRRPDRLARLLSALDAEIAQLGSLSVSVIVIDNDAEGSAKDAATAAHVGYALEVEAGLAAVRNRAIDLAVQNSADAMVFIDDDEIPMSGWLAALASPWQSGSADVVSGRVVSHFEVEPDPWIIAGGFFRRREFSSGEIMRAAPTNNLLVDVALLKSTGVRFDEQFGATGGEDIHFTSTLARRGGRIVAAPEALVTDVVPAERATRRWVLRRAYRVGTTTVRGEVSLSSSRLHRVRTRLRWLAQGVARFGAGLFRWLFGLFTSSTTHQARGARLAARGAGMAAGALGIRYYEYRPRS